MRKLAYLLALVMLAAVELKAQTTLLPFGSTWKYLDNGSNQGTAWPSVSYDDTGWKSGPGILGYGNPASAKETTQLSFGPDPSNTYLTTYFRKTIHLASAFTSFTGRIKRDDGAVVYVNGVEVFRSNMPGGTIAYNTLAYYALDNGTQPQAFTIKGSAFTSGTNVIAVEIHQHSKTSSDMTFDLELVGTGAIAPGDQTAPAVLSINRQAPATQNTNATAVVFRTTFSEAVTGVDATDFQLTGSVSGTLTAVAAGPGNTTFDVTVTASGNGLLGLNLKSSGTGIADAAGNPLSGGFTGQTYILDQTAPTVLGLVRQSPASESTTGKTVVFRAAFSEAVTGVDAADFQATGTAGGTIAALAAVASDNTTFDVTVQAAGTGTLGLNLKSSGTGIADAAANALNGGFTGQTYTIAPPAPATYGFVALASLTPLAAQVDATKGKPQAKVFTHAGRHWAIIANATGTHLWRLDGSSWTNILRLSTRNTRADCIVNGDVTHILLFAGKSSELVSVEYVPATGTYQPWSQRKTKVDLVLDDGVETSSLALDGTGRLWVASDAVTDINVRYSDAPYTSWSTPITIASGINEDDVSAVVAMPKTRQIGVLWGNQQTARFGFRTHTDGGAPASWAADEVPASQSALNEGAGMADDHMDMKIASDGTLYCAVKTGYNQAGFPKIALLIRRPAGTWDNLYGVSEAGTAPIVLLNEALGKVKIIYTSQTYGGDILYKESPTANIAFGPELTLISGVNNYATSTHQLYASDVVVLASNSQQTVGVLASDVQQPATSQALTASRFQTASTPAETPDPALSQSQPELQAYPNPFFNKVSIRFTLPTDGPYTLTLHDSHLAATGYRQQGTARAGKQQVVSLADAGLRSGIYYARLQTRDSVQTIRLLLKK